MTLDKAEIAKLKVAELKAELESRSIEVPKGAKKADLVALLEKQIEGASSTADEPEDSNDVADEIEKISAEDDLAADLAAEDEEEKDVKTENAEETMGLDVHAGEDDLSKDIKTEEDVKADPEPKMPREGGDVRGDSPELEPPPIKKRRESPTHESRSSSHRHAEPREDRRRDRRDRNRAPERMDSDPKWDDSRVQISPYMCDMNLKITDNNRAENINYEGLGYCYGGAKATHGVRGGKVCFELHLSRELPTRHLHADEKSVYWCRVGWSTGMSDMVLGEDIGSLGFDSHAKFAHNKNFIEFGSTYKRGDTIGCFLDLTNPESVTLAYTRNGKQQLGDDGEETITLSRAELGIEQNSAFYPHFIVKNYAVHLHFGRRSSTNSSDLWESAPKALRDFKLIGSVPSEERIAGPVEPQEKRDCTVIMMCGLPCSGKTTWADKHMAENRAKHFHTIGNECIMDRMSICGEKREKYNNKHGTPYDVLQSTTMGAVLRIMERCHRKKRNYILDQANIYVNGHSKKMGPFEGFHRRAVVCVPSEEEYEIRKDKKVKEGGRKITHDSSMKWKAAMTLPEKDSGLFEQIDYLDLNREDAEKLVAEYNKAGEEYKKKMEEKYGTSDRSRSGRRTDSRDNTYSNPPPVVYSNGAGAPGSGASNDANAQAWQEYYKKYYEYYGQYPQGQGMPPPVVSNSSQYSSGSGSDTAQQWAQYQQQYQQYYQQYQQYYQQQMQK